MAIANKLRTPQVVDPTHSYYIAMRMSWHAAVLMLQSSANLRFTGYRVNFLGKPVFSVCVHSAVSNSGVLIVSFELFIRRSVYTNEIKSTLHGLFF